MFKTILVPVDGSEHANRAVAIAADMAVKYGAELVLLHVMTTLGSARVPPDLVDLAKIEHVLLSESDVMRGYAEKIIAAAEARARHAGASRIRSAIRVGQPAEAITAEAKDMHADLVVMGRRGLGSARAVLMGSVSLTVAQLAKCPCMTVE
jgi:nucleotide-binding universal stress UspA family protein